MVFNQIWNNIVSWRDNKRAGFKVYLMHAAKLLYIWPGPSFQRNSEELFSPEYTLQEEHPFLTVFYGDLSLQWWSMRNRYLETWNKIEAIGKENDIAEIYRNG